MDSKWATCSGLGCLRIHRECRDSVGLAEDPVFKEMSCGGCDGEWSSYSARQLYCAEDLSNPKCRWDETTQTTQSQACAPSCMWEVCQKAFNECQINGGTLAACNDQIISMNQCRECYFVSCEAKCSEGACDAAFSSRDQAYRECAACDDTVACNPNSPCYGDNGDSSCNWLWKPEFGTSCPILCEESIRICQESVQGHCHKWLEDQEKSMWDICHEEYDQYRPQMDECIATGTDAAYQQNPNGIWSEIEIGVVIECRDKIIPSTWECLSCDGEWNRHTAWGVTYGPQCIAGSISFDGRTVPDMCSSCMARTCPEYPVNCWARVDNARKCEWNEYSFKMCSLSMAEAKAQVVAANAQCTECEVAHCEYQCQETTCADLLTNSYDWNRNPTTNCAACPSTAKCHPGADCYISDTIPWTDADRADWDNLMVPKFQQLMDQWKTCTGWELNRRLKVKTGEKHPVPKTSIPAVAAPKQPRTPEPSQLETLELKVVNLWRQGNRLRNEARNKRQQLQKLSTSSKGVRFDAVLQRRNLLEDEHSKLQKRYVLLAQQHQETLGRWLKLGGVASVPPHHGLPAFTQDGPVATHGRRLNEGPTTVELGCSTQDCTTQSNLCDAFFNRGGTAEEFIDSLVESHSYDVLPWDSADQICQHMGEMCFMSLGDAETAVRDATYSSNDKIPWIDSWCSQMTQAELDSCVCDTCSDLSTDLNYDTCQSCCQCDTTSAGYYAYIRHQWNLAQGKCDLLGRAIRRSGLYEYSVWTDFDEKLLGGAGACVYRIDIWQVAKIPDICHDPSCYVSPECAEQCKRPEATQAMCPSPFTWQFFKSTREWREGTLSTRSTCEAESCYPQPWIRTQAECATVSHCHTDCPYCETENYWDWESKKGKVPGTGSDRLRQMAKGWVLLSTLPGASLAVERDTPLTMVSGGGGGKMWEGLIDENCSLNQAEHCPEDRYE
ncbi:unnamed protein product [Durusdinium trenchii]|uniref:Uncharacterized protein n=1 Tax=Durusdinium trenchii TaxID=1381693 RepID=A0ABP0R412_9DINO